MATVPITEPREEQPKIDPSFVMMAAAQMRMEAPVPTMNEEEMASDAAQEQSPLKGLREPDEESLAKRAKAHVNKRLKEEEDPDITKYPARNIVPGERIIDRERGLFSRRDIRRL